MTKVVEAFSVGYNYKNFKAVDDISFYVKAGEFFIITGPNGSGKTTLAKIMAGIIKQSHGELKISGIPISEFSAKRLARSVAFVPQDIQIDFPFKAKEIVFMGRYPHTGIFGIETDEDIKIAKEAMRFTGTEEFSERRVDHLSGGERQRVFIARALCQQPEIIILDEPTASLDLSYQIGLMELLKRLKKESNMTVIMVSHDLNLASMYAEKILLLKAGSIIAMGDPSVVFTKKILENVYRCDLMVTKSDFGNFPTIYPIPAA